MPMLICFDFAFPLTFLATPSLPYFYVVTFTGDIYIVAVFRSSVTHPLTEEPTSLIIFLWIRNKNFNSRIERNNKCKLWREGGSCWSCNYHHYGRRLAARDQLLAKCQVH